MKLSLSIRILFFILIFSILQDTTCFRQMKVKHIINLSQNQEEKHSKFFENAKLFKDKNQLILKLTDRDVHLLNVPDVRQSTLYTCGPSSLLAVLSYYKLDNGFREMDFAKMANATEEDGTTPQSMKKTIQNMGIQVQIRENMSIQDIEKSTQMKQPVIVGFQAWSDPEVDWQNDWDDGHYAVIIGYDEQFLYFEDPSLLGSIGYIQKNQFLQRWHDVDGQLRKFYNLGILIKSENKENPVIRYLS